MFMMFQLGRLNVWPTGDLAVRRGWDMIHKNKAETLAKSLDLKGEKLHPYRSVFAWYCYQAVHESRGLDY
jgi:DNA-3-methyladenine glycosylase II